LELIQVIKALSDETRMRILNILKDCSLCVCEIENILNISQSNTSRHLNKLTSAKILEYYKVANYVYYKINENTIIEYPFLKEIIEVHQSKINICRDDYEKLKLHKKNLIKCEDLGTKECAPTI
jgi:ArsR family transcriptional regulator, arsenate/arsenite/antimonite-responsive transcriptional repressor